jgi:hypothetical protein
MGTVTGRRAAVALGAALDRWGFPLGPHPVLTGWVSKGDVPHKGLCMRPLRGGRLEWRVEGASEPTDQVCAQVFRAFSDIGLDVSRPETLPDGALAVTTAHPGWMEEWDPTNFGSQQPCDPLLGTFQLGGFPVGIDARLPVYCVEGGDRVAPRETIEAIVAAVEGEIRAGGEVAGTAGVSANGTFSVLRSGDSGTRGIDHEVRRGLIANFWGDEVTVWRIPGRWLSATAHFACDVPVLVGGRMLDRPRFEVLDEQYGADAPWSNGRPMRPDA